MEKSSIDNDQQHMWFLLLGCIGSTMALLSILPNMVIVIILCKNKVSSDTLVNFRSCACADILCAVLFLVFICPSWFQEEMAFNLTTCSVEGVLCQWAGLVLRYSLVYLMFQRYSQSRKAIGWKESKICFMSPIFIIWLLCGVVAVLPYTTSSTPYSYDPNFSHCVLKCRWMLLAFDIVDYVIPCLLLFIAGTLLSSLQSKPIKRIKTSRKSSSYLSLQRPLLSRNSLSQSSSKYIEMEDFSTHYPLILLKKTKNLKGPMLSSIENHLMGLETRLSFIYISYTSCIFIMITFMFRTYGIWSVPAALSASQLFTFAAGITRSVIPLLVSKAATKHMSRRSRQTRTTMTNNSYYLLPKIKKRAPKRKCFDSSASGFVSFSLFNMSAASGGAGTTHNKVGRQEMEDFWFGCSPDNSLGVETVENYRQRAACNSLRRSKKRKQSSVACFLAQ